MRYTELDSSDVSELDGIDIYELEEGELETQNRLRNLMWTVSGDYSQDTQLDYASFSESKYVSMYDAVKQGGFARYFDPDALAMYLLKKISLGAESGALTNIAQMCVDEAVYPKLVRERPGVRDIRAEAFSWLLDRRFRALSETMPGRIRLALMRTFLNGDGIYEKRIREPLEKIHALGEMPDDVTASDQIIRTVDHLYNTVVDPYFERTHGDLETVLSVTPDKLRGQDWRDFLSEEAEEEALERAAQNLAKELTNFDTATEEEREQERKKRRRKAVNIDAEAVEKMYSYIEKNYGRSYLTEREQKAVNYRLCKGPHADCALYYTDGIIDSHVMVNAQYVNACRQAADNQRFYLNHQHMAKQNITAMGQFLKRILQLRSQKDQILSDHGNIIANRVWRAGRLPDPGKLFYQVTRQNQNDFAVEVLIDASGSQHVRQPQVALQAYIISAALSEANIPHEMMSFCTFWDYTVLQRFRNYDDPPEMDKKVFEFRTSSNNRDGLAIRAAGESLLAREEENKILIVLSDGRPNDVIVGRPGSRNPMPYTGEYAIRDTAYEIRALRSAGVYVLGVFTGTTQDLQAEKRIFDKDFAYIRDIRNFSRVVSSYLGRLLERDMDEL